MTFFWYTLIMKFPKMPSGLNRKTETVQRKILDEQDVMHGALQRNIIQTSDSLLPRYEDHLALEEKDDLEESLEIAQDFDEAIDEARIEQLEKELEQVSDKESRLYRELEGDLIELQSQKIFFDKKEEYIKKLDTVSAVVERNNYRFQNEKDLDGAVYDQNPDLN